MKFIDSELMIYIQMYDKKRINFEESFINLGFELEETIKINKTKDLIVGKVLKAEPHPNADRLKVCSVKTNHGINQVICGGKNVSEGQYIIYAPAGSIVNDITLTIKNLRGIESNGMILSISEILGFDNNYVENKEKDNIYLLDERKLNQSDFDINQYFKLDDKIYDLTILNDRKYANSYLGMAREISAYYDSEFKLINPPFEKSIVHTEREIELDNYANGVYYNDVILKESKTPEDIKRFLYLHQIKPNNTIKDLIAYVSIITGNLIYFLDKDITKFKLEKNKLNYIDIFQSDVIKTNEYKGIFVAFSTDYSININNSKFINNPIINNQFKGTDNSFLEYSLFLLNSLGQRYGYIQKSSTILGKEIRKNKKIKLDLTMVEKYIDKKIDLNKINKKLSYFGFLIDEENNYFLPEYRGDINGQQDIIEEIVRVYGINNIKAKELPENDYKIKPSFEKEIILRLTKLLVKYNLSETKSYFLENSVIAKNYNYWNNRKIWKIKEEYNFLRDTVRTSLFKSLLRAHNYNYRNQNEQNYLFEISNLNINQKDNLYLGIIHDDTYYPQEPILATRQLLIEILKSFNDKVKYKLEDITFEYKPIKMFDTKVSNKIFYKKNQIGIIGQVSLDILREYKYVRLDKIKNTLYYLEINLNFLNNF